MGKTTYRDTFTPKTPGVERSKGNAPSKVLGNHLPFLGESMYRNDFKPYKIHPSTPLRPIKEVIELTPAYDGQYLSDFARNMRPPDKKPCPARRVLENLAEKSTRATDILHQCR